MRRRRPTAMHLLARLGVLHEFCLEEGTEAPHEDAYLNVPVMVDMVLPHNKLGGRPYTFPKT